jgi:putative ABC transport system permease protein
MQQPGGGGGGAPGIGGGGQSGEAQGGGTGSGDSQSGAPLIRQLNPSGASQNVSYISQINSTVNLKILMELLGIGLGLCLLSALAGTASIMRYEPLQILAERN